MPTLKKILFPILLTFLTTVPAWAQSVNIDLGDSGGSDRKSVV